MGLDLIPPGCEPGHFGGGGLHQAPPRDQAPPGPDIPPAARHAGIPPAMHAGIAPPTRLWTDTHL